MSWNTEGRDSLLELLRILRDCPAGLYRTVKLSRPTRSVLMIPNNGSQICSRNKARISSIDCGEMEIVERDHLFCINMSNDASSRFEESLLQFSPNQEVTYGSGAYGISFW